jgi:hypothetical protein
MAVAVRGVGVVVHKIESRAEAALEFIVGGVHAGVDDVDVHSTPGRVAMRRVGSVEGRCTLVDAVESPQPRVEGARREGLNTGREGPKDDVAFDVLDVVSE